METIGLFIISDIYAAINENQDIYSPSLYLDVWNVIQCPIYYLIRFNVYYLISARRPADVCLCIVAASYQVVLYYITNACYYFILNKKTRLGLDVKNNWVRSYYIAQLDSTMIDNNLLDAVDYNHYIDEDLPRPSIMIYF